MPVYELGHALVFPSPSEAVDGLLAVGGDLSANRLLLAYRSGIFPWYSEDLPILWHSPDPRCVIGVDRVHAGRTIRRTIAKRIYEVRFDTAFECVIDACRKIPRAGQDGTWITSDMVDAYLHLHRLGYAHSVEAWEQGELVGGLYGVSVGRVFFGESMYALRPDASKIALLTLAARLAKWGFRIIDSQVATPQTLALGAEEWPRDLFLKVLAEDVAFPTRRGSWTNEDPALEA